jgi:hypothetical protein
VAWQYTLRSCFENANVEDDLGHISFSPSPSSPFPISNGPETSAEEFPFMFVQQMRKCIIRNQSRRQSIIDKNRNPGDGTAIHLQKNTIGIWNFRITKKRLSVALIDALAYLNLTDRALS